MAGFREFAPGQVWFYYNPNATKSLEQKKELGACTSRPVVIVQNAFYMEWNDIVTVCPMTMSDRRSGVYIDSTILKDGSLIEGGTIIPYLFFNIRTKYLYPVIASNQKRKLLTLSEEDFAKVQHGIQYHMGFRSDPPEYVQAWKHLSDFDRNIVIQDVRLAINAYDDIINEQNREHRRPNTNPVLRQEAPESSHVENHIIAAMTHYDRTTQTISTEHAAAPFNPKSLNASSQMQDNDSAIIDHASDTKMVVHKPTVTFTQMSPSEFSDVLSIHVDGIFPTAQNHYKLRDGSKFLENISLKDMPEHLTRVEMFFILIMSISEIIKKSGIRSTSTAMRLRKSLRELSWGGVGHTDESGSFIPDCENWPDGFSYTGKIPFLKTRVKRSAKRRAALFKLTKEQHLALMKMDDRGIASMTGLPISYSSYVRSDIALMYPNEHFSETIQTNDSDDGNQSYLYEETLSSGEAMEFMNCPQKSIGNLVSNFGLTKSEVRQIRARMRERKDLPHKRPPISNTDFDAIVHKAVFGKMSEPSLTHREMLIFCMSCNSDIFASYRRNKMAMPPSKAETRRLKSAFRRILTR